MAAQRATRTPRWVIAAVPLVVVGIAGYDGVRTGMTKFTAQDDASSIARDSATYFYKHHDITSAYNAALAEAQAKGETIAPEQFAVSGGNTVTLTLAKKNDSTLVLTKLHASWDEMSGKATSTFTP